MVYLPTFGWFLGNMLVNIPYIEHMGHGLSSCMFFPMKIGSDIYRRVCFEQILLWLKGTSTGLDYIVNGLTERYLYRKPNLITWNTMGSCKCSLPQILGNRYFIIVHQTFLEVSIKMMMLRKLPRRKWRPQHRSGLATGGHHSEDSFHQRVPGSPSPPCRR